MGDSIQLTLVNKSTDMNNSKVLIFQQNTAAKQGELALAWKVVQNLGRDWTFSFQYPYDLTIGVMDSYGNASPQQPAAPGQLFRVFRDGTGDEISAGNQKASDSQEIQISNDLEKGAVTACIYRDGTLLATKTGVAPGQIASFKFDPCIYIGVVSQYDVTPGAVIDSAILSKVNQKISLLGVTQGTITMAGGGPGRTSSPFTFTLTAG